MSLIWGAVSLLKNWLYDKKWLPAAQVEVPVVSVGNIVAGGAGKTPLVLLLGQTFSCRKVAILSRKYGAVPDEPVLLGRRLPHAKVYVGKDRVSLAKQAVREGAELIVLDDGFQYRKLFRDFDLVIVDGNDPYGKGHYLPWGFLRDSPKRLRSADAIFIQGEHPDFSEAIQVKMKVNRARLSGLRVGTFCGIAKPRSFKKTVEGLGAKIVLEWVLADHEPADLQKLASFADSAKSLGANALVCTEKDFVKLPPGFAASLPIVYLEIEFEIAGRREKWEKLIAKIDQKIDNSTRYERRCKN